MEVKQEYAFAKAAFMSGENVDGPQSGMTIRDYFAAKCMNGLCSNMSGEPNCDLVARWSYEMADAMLKERSNP